MRPARSWQSHAVALYRLALLVAIVLLARVQHEKARAARTPEFPRAMVQKHFPDAERLRAPDPASGIQEVVDATGQRLGFVFKTSPKADHIAGYSGPTDTAVCLDEAGAVMAAEILWSEDTADHVEAVERDSAFWKSFQGVRMGAGVTARVDAVSGATLTSTAVARALLERLGASGVPSLFPDAVTLDEIRELLPLARQMSETGFGQWRVVDENGEGAGIVLRTSPLLDTFIGYQGPVDVLLALDGEGRAATVSGLKLRGSYDNEPYVGYIREDPDYLRLYDGWEIGRVAAVDFEAEGIEGVSGATTTSWAIAEATRRRAADYLTARDVDPGGESRAGWSRHDVATIAMVAGALALSFSRLRGNKWLRIGWQLLVVVYLGCVAGNLVSQALLAGWAKAGIPWQSSAGLAVLGLAALLVPWSSGHQLYCHHLCPHGVLQQWLLQFRKWRGWKPTGVSPRLDRMLRALPWLLCFLTVAVLFFGLPVNLADIEPFDAWVIGVAGTASIVIAIVGLVISAFYPMAYCRYGCPTGALLSFLRSKGANDRFGAREWVASGCVLIGALITRVFMTGGL